MEFFDDDGGVLIDAVGANSDSPNDPVSSALQTSGFSHTRRRKSLSRGLRSAPVPDALPEFGQLAFEVESPEKGVRIAIDLCDHTWSEVLVIDPAQVRRSAVIDRVVQPHGMRCGLNAGSAFARMPLADHGDFRPRRGTDELIVVPQSRRTLVHGPARPLVLNSEDQ